MLLGRSRGFAPRLALPHHRFVLCRTPARSAHPQQQPHPLSRGFFSSGATRAQKHWLGRVTETWRALWAPPVWLRRPIRALRVAALSISIFEMGKAKGHTEALEDPEAMLDGLIKGILCSQHVSSTGAQAAFHEVGSPQYEHVRAVGVRVMEAARTFVQSEIKKLETELSVAARRSDAERVAEITAAIEEFKAGARRLTGEWRWVVTNSEAINAFVSPYCPRHVFVHEGLMNELRPTDDELAFLIAHEVSHVIHAHADETLARTAAAAQVQLVVLSLIDPTGLLSFLITYAFGVWLDASYVKSHSRFAESQADDTGVQIMHLACFDSRSAGSMMAKMGAASGHTRASWLDTHPPVPEREQSLERRAIALSVEGAAEDCNGVRALLRSLYTRAAGSGTRK